MSCEGEAEVRTDGKLPLLSAPHAPSGVTDLAVQPTEIGLFKIAVLQLLIGADEKTK